MNEHAKALLLAGSPATIPATYVAFIDFMTDPMKVAGLVVLILQGWYLVIQIRKASRSKNVTESEG